MNKVMNFFQEKVMNILIGIGENRYMQVLRNGVMVIIPFTVIGSIFLIISSFPSEIWQRIVKPYVPMLNVGYNVTFGLIAIFASLGIGYYMSKMNKTDPLTGSLVSLACFLTLQITPDYGLDITNFGASGLFTAIIVGLLSNEIIYFFVKRNLVIKLPKGVPPAVSNSFTVLVPSIVAIVGFWFIRVVLNFDLNIIITKILSPLVFGLNTLPGLLVLVFFILLLWVCGIHGDSVFSGIYTPVFLGYLAANAAAVKNGQPIPYITADGFFYFGMWFGGTGGTIGLVLLMLKSKSKTYRSLGKICFSPSIFCINEPLVFGFPIVLNPLIMIPYILTPMILLSITYFLMHFNIIGRPIIAIPWTTPPIISGFISTGGDFRAAIWQIIELFLSALIYYPFFKILEKREIAKENGEITESEDTVLEN